MTEIGSYSFLPWLRQGLANNLRPPTTGTRATIPVSLTLAGDAGLAPPITKDVELYGPGDVVGIDRRSIVKTEPRAFATNFESNYLPYIEFQAEDFPWRYTPEAPAGHRLRPWVALAVLKEDEFADGAGDPSHPFIVVAAADAVLPPLDQAWAWAHVHVDGDLADEPGQIVSTDLGAVLPRLASVLTADPDQGHSRLVCPRRLDVSTTYHAFVVPVFETGRLAGLGLDPALSPSASQSAWGAGAVDLPYYYRWTFRTGPFGDFEYLVRLLEARPMDSRVGRRDVDVQHPGSNLVSIDDPALGGVLRLGGALRVPPNSLSEDELAEFNRFENWDRVGYPQPFQRDLAAFVNLASDYNSRTAPEAHAATSYDATVPDPDRPGQTIDDPDPLITPPLYGRWPAAVSRLLTDEAGAPLEHDDNWVHRLNLDPRHRLAAGFGTEVVRRAQETFMLAAWEQIGAVIAANRRVHDAQVAKLVASAWFVNTLLPLASEPTIALTRPVQRRTLVDGMTVHRRVEVSPVPQAVTSVTARQVLRPRGPVVRKVAPGPNLLDRLNKGEVTAAPPVPALTNTPTLEDLASGLSGSLPPWLARLLRRFPRLSGVLVLLGVLLLILALVVGVTGGSVAIVIAVMVLVVAAVVFVLARAVTAAGRKLAVADAVRETGQTPAAVDGLPNSPDFEVAVSRDAPAAPTIGGRVDGLGTVLFKEALKNASILIQADVTTPSPPRPVQLDLAVLVTGLEEGLNPAITVPRLVESEIALPERIRAEIGNGLVEVMAYPEIDTPMAKPLIDLAVDHFLPNIGLIPPNTISLLETNQAFIEAYMVGLNHEFARELLWREYPTDQRGSYFRQFWDVAGFLTAPGVDPAVVREQLKDIPPLHQWAPESSLGDHDHREVPGDNEQEVVLVVRGELLKRYPTAVIYAHRAAWQFTHGTIDKSLPRKFEEPGDGADRALVKTPLYEAAADPDIRFFGFDLTVPEARGLGDDPGWFFVIKERPGEPRFGFDIGGGGDKHVWNDLGWDDVLPGGRPGDHLAITPATPTISLTPPPSGATTQEVEQASDDRAVRWHAGADAAELAYILQQVPVLVAVHAAEMLPEVNQ